MYEITNCLCLSNIICFCVRRSGSGTLGFHMGDISAVGVLKFSCAQTDAPDAWTAAQTEITGSET